jgi:DNA-binding XRE family transcriptional regulator
MSDVQRYIEERGKRDPVFVAGYELSYADLKLGIMLRQVREAAGLTQEQVAWRLGTQKSTISRMENHAEDVRLSTLRAYAQAVGAELRITLTGPKP